MKIYSSSKRISNCYNEYENVYIITEGEEYPNHSSNAGKVIPKVQHFEGWSLLIYIYKIDSSD